MTATANSAKYQPPSPFEALFNRTFGFLASLGLAPKFIYQLEVRGRKTGKIYRSPVNLMEIAGKRILVAPRGRTQWVRNAEATGEIVLKRAAYRQAFSLRPIADADKPPILKEYLHRYASAVKKFFPIPPNSPSNHSAQSPPTTQSSSCCPNKPIRLLPLTPPSPIWSAAARRRL
jgi:F420H(2)-dependent quinone reductase